MSGPPTFAERWRRAVECAGDRPFLTFDDLEGNVRRWTYAEFDALVAEVAGRMRELGAEGGGRIHLMLANSPAFVALWLAAARIGATIVPADPRARARELTEHFRRTKPVVGICSTEMEETYRDAAEAEELRYIAVAEADCELGDLRGPSLAEGTAPGPLDAAAIMFTSGTTAAPKGVVVTQANYAFAGDVMAAAAALRPDDRCIVVLPLFHANAQYYSFAAAISVGAQVALMARFSASGFIEQVRRHEATHASLFAAPIRMILARTAPETAPVKLAHCWFAQDLAPSEYEAFAELIGVRPRQLYGMTETIPAVLTAPVLEPMPDSIGRPTIACDVRLVAPDGEGEPPPGEVGEIAVSGRPGIELFAGYLDDPETTAASFREGLFLTGDLARRDERGRYRFAGRRGDVLKVAGENVSTVEVESVLAEHPGVLDCAVVGEADPVRDEVPVAHVVRAEGHEELDEAALIEWCRRLLAPSKVPRRVVFHEKLPRTSVGKIRKFALR